MNTQTIASAGTGGGGGNVTANTTAGGNSPPIIYLNQHQASDHHTTLSSNTNHLHHHHPHQQQSQQQHHALHHQLIQSPIDIIVETTKTSGDTSYQMSQMQPVPNTVELTQHEQTPFLLQNNATHHPPNAISVGDMDTTTPAAPTALLDQNQNVSPSRNQQQDCKLDEQQLLHSSDQLDESHDQQSSATRFKWTNEKTQVALNLVKHGCKPKLIAVAVGCSLRTAQKFAETVTPKIEGDCYKNYEIKRRGRKSKDVNQRLNAIRAELRKDSNKTQVEIAADLRVSNTTVCRDLKRIGASWKEKKHAGGGDHTLSDNDTTHDNNGQQTTAVTSPSQQQQQQQQTSTRKTRQSNARAGQNSNSTTNNTGDSNEPTSAKARKRPRRANAKIDNENDLAGQDHQLPPPPAAGTNQ